MWGENEDQDFSIPAGGLTDSFVSNFRKAVFRQTDMLLLYLLYNKGSESGIEISISYVSIKVPGQSFLETAIVPSTGLVKPFYHVLEESGSFRLALPTGLAEEQALVSVRAKGTAPYTGSVVLWFATNNLKSR